MPANLSAYNARETLRDGRSLSIRPIRPDDRRILHEEFLKLSPASVRERFFNVKTDLTPQELTYFTEVDFVRHVALVAQIESDGAPLPAGVGRFVRSDGEPVRCEAAITVADALQGYGIGYLLLAHLISCARKLGLRHFDASVLPQNNKMIHLLHKTGLPIESSRQDGILTYSLSL